MFPSHISWILTFKKTTQEFKSRACMHHVVIIVNIVIIAVVTLCYSIMSHVTLVLFYHASMLTPQNSFISQHLVATSVILWSVQESTSIYSYGFAYIPDLLIEHVFLGDSFANREAKPLGSDYKVDGS
jgi:hypothetical protein